MENELNQIAYTAFRVTFYVALEQYEAKERRLIDDDLARQMLPPRLKLALGALRFKPLRQGFLGLIDRGFPGTRGNLCRKRFIDDKLIEALEAGIESVVILGSGLDTRPYRIPQLSSLQVYEVDLPDTIAYKASRLRQLYGAVPSQVRLVPIDFDRQRLEDVLRNQGYSLDQKSFIIWEGVTQYLSPSAVYTVFEFLAKLKPGSRMVFTYIAQDFIAGQRSYGLEKLFRQTRSIWHFGLHPADVAGFIAGYSWQELEQVGAAEYQQRYILPAGRTDAALGIERAVFAEKTIKQPVPRMEDC